MASKLRITIVGAGRLGRALALGLKQAGFRVDEIVSRDRAGSRRGAQTLAGEVGAAAVTFRTARLRAELIWFLVPDREIPAVAKELASAVSWKGKIAFHSSGALSSDELNVLREQGAAVASVHPFMTFVSKSIPALAGVPFGIEGDARAVRLAREVARKLGAEPFLIAGDKKAAYHAWGGFTSPLLVSLLVTPEEVAASAGFSRKKARRWALPILQQTIANYARLGPADTFSGPIVRGDAEVVRKHLRALKGSPAAREVYVALARVALRKLPSRNRKELGNALDGK